MDFTTWARHLSDRDIHLISPSHPTPVRVRALLPSGDLAEFLCRGTTATLARYAASDLVFVEPRSSGDGCGCGCGEALAEPVTAPRVVVRAGAEPRRVVRFEGATERGWTGYEAGLLSVDEAAPLFDSLLAAVGPLDSRGPATSVHYGRVRTFFMRTVGLSGSSLSTTASAT